MAVKKNMIMLSGTKQHKMRGIIGHISDKKNLGRFIRILLDL